MLTTIFGLMLAALILATFGDGGGDAGDPNATVIDPSSSGGSGPGDDGVDDALAQAFAEADAEGDEEGGEGEEEPVGDPAEPDNREQSIPRPRFDEVNNRLATLRPFEPVLERLTAAGATPEQAAAYVLQALEQGATPQPEAQPDPDEAFAQFLQDQGIDPYDEHSPATLAALRVAFNTQQTLQGIQAQTQQAQQQAWLAERRAELQAVQAQFPEYQDPEEARSLVAEWEAAPDGTSLAQVAERQRARFETRFRNRLAEQAATRPSGASRPVTAGGSTPSPAQVPDFTKMSDAQREEYAEAQLATLLAAGD